MAALGEFFGVGNFHGTVVGVTQCSLAATSVDAPQKKTELSNDFVAITVQETGVQVYNVNDQKCVKSWSVKPGFRFSRAAIQHPKTQLFYAIQKDKILHSWDLKTELEKGKRREFSELMFDLKATKHFDGVTVISRQGQLALVNASLQPSKFVPAPNPARQVLWVMLVERAADAQVLVLFTENDSLFLNVFIITPQLPFPSLTFKTLQITQTNPNLYPINCAFDELSQALIVVWSDYTWEKFELPSGADDGEGSALTSQMSIPLRGFESTMRSFSNTIEKKSQLFGKSGFSCTIVRPSFLALVGMQKNSNLVTLWSVKYGILHAEQSIERNTFEPSQLADSFRLSLKSFTCGTEEFLILTDVSRVWASRFTFRKEGLTLMDVLGRMNDTAPHLATSGLDSFLRPPAPGISNVLMDPDADVERWRSEIEQSQKKEKEFLEILTDSSRTPTKEQFSEQFFKYIKLKTANSYATSSGHAADQLHRQSTVDISHHFLSLVLDRCFEDDISFPTDVVDFMISSNMLSVSESKMLQKLADKRELALLEKCLLHIFDIPEPDLVKLLRFFLSEIEEETLDAHVRAKHLPLFAGDSPRDYFLYLIISAPRNDIFLQSSIKTLTIEEVQMTLNFLRRMLRRHSEHLEPALKAMTKTRFPTYAQILDWICVVLDAHFTQLIMSANCHAALRELRDLVTSEAEVCDKIETLPGRIAQLLHRSNPLSTSAKKMVGTYTIEAFSFEP